MRDADLFAAELFGKPAWMWGAFLLLVATLLFLDLGVLHRRSREIGVRESLLLSGFYVSLGVAFGGWIWSSLGEEQAFDFWTGLAVEQSLSMDNLFVMATIFAFVGIPRKYQHRALFWGVLGVIALRGLMIGAGVALLETLSWALYLFAAFLVFTGVKVLFLADEGADFEGDRVLRLLQRRIRVTDRLDGEAFFTSACCVRTGQIAPHATPLFLALVLIELADIVFAVDSIPAILTITTDPFVVYTSNIFAILGLRAMYFALSALMARFHYMKYALGTLLIFIGAKVFAADLIGLEEFPPEISLAVTIGVLALGVLYSLWRTRGREAAVEPVERGVGLRSATLSESIARAPAPPRDARSDRGEM